jgi:dCTP diphosphatase
VTDQSLASIQQRLEEFRDDRDWDQFHSLANLAAAISVEAGELLDLFLWSPPVEEGEILDRKRDAVESELADVMIQCLNLAASAKIDIINALDRKIAENAKKYPVAKSKGSAAKYSDL